MLSSQMPSRIMENESGFGGSENWSTVVICRTTY